MRGEVCEEISGQRLSLLLKNVKLRGGGWTRKGCTEVDFGGDEVRFLRPAEGGGVALIELIEGELIEVEFTRIGFEPIEIARGEA